MVFEELLRQRKIQPHRPAPAEVACLLAFAHPDADRIAAHLLAFEGDSKVTFSDGAPRAGGWGARRRLTCPAQPLPRARVGGGPIARATDGPCSRGAGDYEASRTQQLGDAATRRYRITYWRLTR
jgi:hypothetical protein